MIMLLNQKPWVLGLLQAFLIFLYTIFVYFALVKIFLIIGLSYTSVTPYAVTILPIILFITSILAYALILLAIPLQHFLKKEYASGIGVLVYTVVFLILLIAAVVLSLILVAPENPGDSYPGSRIRMFNREIGRNPNLEDRIMELPQDTSKPMPTFELQGQQDSGIYPYKININTGEKTPL